MKIFFHSAACYFRAQNFTHKSSNDRVIRHLISHLNCFAAGIFFGTCILHMIPEVGKKVEKAFPSDYPIGHLIFALGFFFVFFIEQMVTMCCMKKTVPAGDNHEDHDHDEAKK